MEKKTWAVFLGMGFELTGLVLVGTFIGRYFDDRYHWNGMGVLAGCMIALVGWMVHFFILFREVQKGEDS